METIKMTSTSYNIIKTELTSLYSLIESAAKVKTETSPTSSTSSDSAFLRKLIDDKIVSILSLSLYSYMQFTLLEIQADLKLAHTPGESSTKKRKTEILSDPKSVYASCAKKLTYVFNETIRGNFISLSEDLQQNIHSFLTLKESGTLAIVSWGASRLTQDPVFWRQTAIDSGIKEEQIKKSGEDARTLLKITPYKALYSELFPKIDPTTDPDLSNLSVDITQRIINLMVRNRDYLGTIKKITIANRGISYIPNEVWQFFPNLKNLDCSKNTLTTLPASIGKLKNLKSLTLTLNRFNSIPECLYDIPKLTNLDISGNKFTTLPERLWTLKKMVSFYANDNQISEISPGIKKFKKLSLLNLEKNPLDVTSRKLIQSLENEELFINIDEENPDNQTEESFEDWSYERDLWFEPYSV